MQIRPKTFASQMFGRTVRSAVLAPMVKRISRDASDVEFWVRFLVGALEMEMSDMLSCRAERVWFNGRTSGCQSDDGSSILPTRTERGQKKNTSGLVFFFCAERGAGMYSYAHVELKWGLKFYFVVVQNSGDTGDKGQGTFMRVHEIVRE